MASCRPATVTIDAPAAGDDPDVDKTEDELRQLKGRIKAALAERWLAETADLPKRMISELCIGTMAAAIEGGAQEPAARIRSTPGPKPFRRTPRLPTPGRQRGRAARASRRLSNVKRLLLPIGVSPMLRMTGIATATG